MCSEFLTEDGRPVPESWLDRCSGDGYTKYIDENGTRRYTDNGEEVGERLRPCARCGKYPDPDGDDFCIQKLGKVLNACCGHGTSEGYIQFEGGITIRGYFNVYYDDPDLSKQRLGNWDGKS